MTRIRSAHGFTLLEVMTTVVVLSVGIVAVHQAFGSCLQAMRRSEEKLFCAFWIEKKTTELMISSPARALEDASRQEPPAEPGFSMTDDAQPVMRGDRSFVLHRLKVQGPSGAKIECPVLTAAPPDV